MIENTTATDQNKGRDGLMRVSLLIQSRVGMFRQLANRKDRRADGRLCPLRNFPSPRWLSHRERGPLLERKADTLSIHAGKRFPFFFFFISSFLSLRHPHTFFSVFFLRRDWNVTSPVYGCAQGLIPHADQASAGRSSQGGGDTCSLRLLQHRRTGCQVVPGGTGGV